MAKKNLEKIKEINSHKWEWTGMADQAFSELTGSYFICEYCGKELEYHYEMENENNDRIYVGSECMKKMGWIQTDRAKTKMKSIKENFKKEKEQKVFEKETGIKIGSKISSKSNKLKIEEPEIIFSGKKPNQYVIVKGFEVVEAHSGLKNTTDKQRMIIKTTGITNMFYDNVQDWLNKDMIKIEQ